MRSIAYTSVADTDPNQDSPDPHVFGMDPDPAPDLDPSITKQKSKKNLDS